MTILFSDGQVGSTLETAHNLSAWTEPETSGGAISASTTVAYDGTYSIKSVLDANGTRADLVKTFTAADLMYLGAYVYFTSFPTANAGARVLHLDRGYLQMVSECGVYNSE